MRAQQLTGEVMHVPKNTGEFSIVCVASAHVLFFNIDNGGHRTFINKLSAYSQFRSVGCPADWWEALLECRERNNSDRLLVCWYRCV